MAKDKGLGKKKKNLWGRFKEQIHGYVGFPEPPSVQNSELQEDFLAT